VGLYSLRVLHLSTSLVATGPRGFTHRHENTLHSGLSGESVENNVNVAHSSHAFCVESACGDLVAREPINFIVVIASLVVRNIVAVSQWA